MNWETLFKMGGTSMICASRLGNLLAVTDAFDQLCLYDPDAGERMFEHDLDDDVLYTRFSYDARRLFVVSPTGIDILSAPTWASNTPFAVTGLTDSADVCDTDSERGPLLRDGSGHLFLLRDDGALTLLGQASPDAEARLSPDGQVWVSEMHDHGWTTSLLSLSGSATTVPATLSGRMLRVTADGRMLLQTDDSLVIRRPDGSHFRVCDSLGQSHVWKASPTLSWATVVHNGEILLVDLSTGVQETLLGTPGVAYHVDIIGDQTPRLWCGLYDGTVVAWNP